MRNIKWVFLLAPLMFIVASCNQSNPVVPPLSGNEVQASITGEGFFNATDALGYDSVTFYYVYATETFQSGLRSVTLTIPKQSTVPYTVTVGSDPVGTISYTLAPSNTSGPQYFAAPHGVGSGLITVTQISPTLEGSFSGTLWQLPPSGSDTVRTITNGQFNAAFVH